MSLIEVNWTPPPRQLRNFGLICLGVGVGLGVWVYLRHRLFGFHLQPDRVIPASATLAALGAACAAIGLVRPMALRPVYVGLTLLTLPIGMVVSYVVLAIVYYGVITPVGLFFRLIGRDPLHRRLDRSGTTYWIARQPVESVESYFRQF